jgi:hypothetical protein
MAAAGDGGELMNQERSSDDNLIISYLTLRKLVGWLGLSLPFVLPAGFLIFFSGKFPGSISRANLRSLSVIDVTLRSHEIECP